jgi:putative OPT family oligopeptide transporter
MPSSRFREIFISDYREITPAAIILGLTIGIVLTSCWTYVGMILGFTIPGSEIAAIIGYGVLRGILRRSTIIENNINQTIASGINIASAGVIFTIPVLYIQRIDFNPWVIGLGCIAGSILGVAFIIPIRKQMLDLERLRFPSGTAVATILKSPGAGVEKAILLGIGFALSAIFAILIKISDIWPTIHIIPEHINLNDIINKILVFFGSEVGIASYINNVWAISLLTIGAGFISGRPGFVVVIGGILANWIIAPVAVEAGWIPDYVESSQYSNFIYRQMNRPLGIGMLIGGALCGIVLAFPSIRSAFKSLKMMDKTKASPEEMPLKVLYAAVFLSFLVLFITAYIATPEIRFYQAVLIALIGTLWLWLAGVIVAQCTGMTDWSPISGLALIAVTLMLYLTSKNIVAAVLIGAAVCVAISQCADMMTDLKTGYLVGAKPVRQQTMQLLVAWIGPIIALIVVGILWEAYGFGPGKTISAPQAQALSAAIDGVMGGDVPYVKYLYGGILGAALSASGIAALGVLVGLSMYLPFMYILTFSIGCIANMIGRRLKGAYWVEERGVPFAAGLIVGESVIFLIVAIIKLVSV